VHPPWQLQIRPHYSQVLQIIGNLCLRADGGQPVWLACDIETRQRQMSCFGFAWSTLDALCIPFLGDPGTAGYWTADEERGIVLALRRLLTHPNVLCIWQNGAYDLQYFCAQYGFLPNATDDTMLMQHVAFPGLRKGLDFLSSLYCRYHRYWKDDGKEWAFTHDDDQHWRYNCEDCVRTFEIHGVLQDVLRSLGLGEQYKFQMERLFPLILRMMIRGVSVDGARRRRLVEELKAFIVDALAWVTHVAGRSLNPNSPKQMTEFFYDELGIPPIISRKTGNATFDDEAMLKVERRNPMLHPLLQAIRDIRSARTALANVLEARLSPDGRARCTYNVGGTETFRLASSEDAFGDGLNLQNITIGDEE
jgi:DNA polymerase I-like protein with 3'-5' exonuclease and polymerase domains